MTTIPDELHRRILEGSPDAVLVSDREGKVRFWNAAAVRTFGFTQAEAVGASMDLVIPERLRGRHWGGWDQVMATGVTRYGEGQLLAVPALHKDGRQLSVEFSIQLLKDGAGRIEWVVAIFRDVTERFLRDKALKLRVKDLEARLGGPRLVKRLDARPLRAAGIHPVEEVLRDLAALAPGEAYELVTPHVPGPVLERAAEIGVRGVTAETGPAEFVTTFTRPGQTGGT
jgi:PAS domain S-box-containing protein